MARVRVFQYRRDLDVFVVAPLYREITKDLGVAEEKQVKWIERLFCMDQDFGESWSDRLDEREEVEAGAKQGRESREMPIAEPEGLVDRLDGRCHDHRRRVQFWREVMMSLELSDEALFAKARWGKEMMRRLSGDDGIADLEERIARWRVRLDADPGSQPSPG